MAASALRRWARKVPFMRRLYAEAYALRYARAKLRGSDGSYAQDGEDLAVEKLIGRVDYFIDIGAHDGISVSNTFYFARRGAAGLCFEPVEDTFHRLSALYRFNRRVVCRNYGISDADRDAPIRSADFLSFLPETEDAQHTEALRTGFMEEPGTETVRLRTFASATEGVQVPERVDLLSVDVEGHELNVLRSIPFERMRFGAIVIETHVREGNVYRWRHRDHEEIIALLRQAGYKPAHQSRVNTIFLPQ